MVPLAVVWYVAWEVAHRGNSLYDTAFYKFDDADEWRYAACSRLVEHGYHLFSQVFSAQPPLLFLSLGEGMRLFGDSIAGARVIEVAFGLLTLLSTAAVAGMLRGPVAAGAAALLLAISPGFLVYSHAVEAEGPMMALVTLSLALVLFHRYRSNEVVAGAAGLALAAAILFKFFAVAAILPIAWALVSEDRSLTERCRSLLAVGIAALLPVAADLLLVSPRQQWDQVFRLHEQAARLQLPNTTAPLDLLWSFVRLDAGLALLAFTGLAALVLTRQTRSAGFVALWVLGAIAMLLGFRPLFPHHLAILLAGFAASAGIAIDCAVARVERAHVVTAVPLALLALLWLLLAPGVARADRHVLVPGQRAIVSTLSPYVDAHTITTDLLATDDLAIADAAHRLVAPPLCDPSNVRLRAGFLTASELIGATREYRVRLVLPSFGIFVQVPEYMRWLRDNYTTHKASGGQLSFWRR